VPSSLRRRKTAWFVPPVVQTAFGVPFVYDSITVAKRAHGIDIDILVPFGVDVRG
jgi:hypothetical protein